MKPNKKIIEKVIYEIQEALENLDAYEECCDELCDDELCKIYKAIQYYIFYNILEHPYERYKLNKFNIIEKKIFENEH